MFRNLDLLKKYQHFDLPQYFHFSIQLRKVWKDWARITRGVTLCHTHAVYQLLITGSRMNDFEISFDFKRKFVIDSRVSVSNSCGQVADHIQVSKPGIGCEKFDISIWACLPRNSIWGQFHQPFGVKHKCAGKRQVGTKRCHSVSPTKLRPTKLVHRTRSYTQLLHCILCTICQ